MAVLCRYSHSFLRLQDTQLCELTAQTRRVAVENDAPHTGVFRRLDIGGGVVDKETLLRLQAELLKERLIDGRLRLQQVVVGGDERAAEPLVAGNIVPVGVLAGGGVAQQV